MKTNYNYAKALAVTLFFSAASWSQATLVQWNFNGTSNTTVIGGENSPAPSAGAGSAALVGGTTATFANGNETAGTTETATGQPPNYAWNTTNYPALGTGNKTRGVQFNVSTAGQAGIVLAFEQRLSNTAANTYVVQYTTDRTVASPVWVDSQTFTFTPAPEGTGDTWYNNRTVDFSSVAALNNNPNVAFRILSAFDPSQGNYLAARSTSTYAGGTVRYDMVRVTSNTTLAVSQFDQANVAFTISPNPSRNETVLLNQVHDIEVYDMVGKLVHKAKNASSINTQSFTSGVYFIKTATGLSKKLIVE